MTEPFMGEVRMMSFNFAPKGWALCDGQLLPINQNQALYSLLGTTYGGDGRNNFALPDLRGRTPLHTGRGIVLGQKAGEETHILSKAELPAHNHVANGVSANGNAPVPTANILAAEATPMYGSAANLVTMAPGTIGPVGGSQGHANMQPYLTLNFCIALQGLFPSRS